jgi:hypothetical protein
MQRRRIEQDGDAGIDEDVRCSNARESNASSRRVAARFAHRRSSEHSRSGAVGGARCARLHCGGYPGARE